MPLRPINLAIADDHVLFRKTLENYLSEQDLSVSIQTSDIFDLLDRLKATPVDILLMDFFMPGLSGNEAVKTIRNEFPAVKILMLSMSTDMELISELLDSGIHGYISKSDEPEELLRAIQVLANNRIYRNRWFTEALYWSKQNNINVSPYTASPAILNEREKKILQLLWEEKNNKEIADELFLGVRSVEKIRQDIKEKIGARSTVGLLKYAIHKNIVFTDLDRSGLVR
jgi:DNA-binding NarL/FixJ family response regulator